MEKRQRAETVLAKLAAGHGAEKPLADNGSEEGRAKNRRLALVKR